MNTPHSTPTSDNPDAVERALASLTRGPYGPDDPDAAAGLWLKALDKAAPAAASTPHLPIWKRPVPRPWLMAASVLMLFGVCASVFTPRAENRAPMAAVGTASTGVDEEITSWKKAKGYDGDGGHFGRSSGYRNGGTNTGDSDRERRLATNLGGMGYEGAPASSPPAAPSMIQGAPGSPSSTPPADRFVIRKVTLDLTAADVRSTFAKASLVINEAVGEYIEASSLTGEGQNASATITLRVTAAHMSEALNQLRTLVGVTVVAEQSGGQDVTDTVVDLDARIRNEQRIEKEVLALIDKRPDAPLKDILEIRAQLEGVRGRIEQLIGQRDRIGRMVSLATILVTVKPVDAPKPVEKPAEKKDDSIGAYFKESIAASWHTSLVALADTAAFFVRTIVGGVVWWVATAAVTIAVWRAVKQTMAKRAAEPAPVG